jgi:hypothetical protein
MFNGKIHYKWSFSIAMLDITRGYPYDEGKRQVSALAKFEGGKWGAIPSWHHEGVTRYIPK